MPKVSIIVPIYNVEAFLPECLESIKNQTFKDWECLMFSDGSKDGSIDIMKSFAKEDSRFVVIEKENEGYGATCNRGLERAKGEWISIIEPDDFIDPHMYERLLSNVEIAGKNSGETGENGETLDIIKGGYWLFYDGKDGYKSAVETPNLCYFMPEHRTIFNLSEFAEPFYHHPSIWSALYRKDFLNGNNRNHEIIRFKPIPGAGWTDNPFFAQTMVLANKICWNPGKYYYYRQTNPGASSLLKDFHLPFDRLRDMREFLSKQNVSREILHAFYSREFDYVNSLITEFGFDDKNPEIRKLIYEVFSSMDSKEVFLMASRLKPEFMDYYMDFLGSSYEVKPQKAEANPKLSLVIFTHNAHSWIVDSLKACSSISSIPCEFIIVDSHSNDSTLAIAQKFTSKDKRFTIQSNEDTASIKDMIAKAISGVRGTYTMFMPSSYIINEKVLCEALNQVQYYNEICAKDSENAAKDASKTASVDLAFFNNKSKHSDYLIDCALKNSAKTKESNILQQQFIMPTNSEDANKDVSYGLYKANDISELLLDSCYSYGWQKIWRTDFLKASKAEAGEHDLPSTLMTFTTRAALKAQKILYCDLSKTYEDAYGRFSVGADEGFENLHRTNIPENFWLSIEHHATQDEAPLEVDSVIETGEWLKSEGLLDQYNRGYVNSLVNSFVHDCHTRVTSESLADIVHNKLQTVLQIMDYDQISKNLPSYFYDELSYNEFQKLQLNTASRTLWLKERMLKFESKTLNYEQEISSIRTSARYVIGEKIVKTAKKIAFPSIIAKLQKKFRLMRRNSK
ncbi:glycosyltransferase family 2 protein [Gardnerella greenwoodii]|uniref:glycosyltransferase family 2 protein n=1 Tax=Gardnerella greenwoodii TaxID=2914925 RepID=UPI0039F12C65